MAQNSSSGMTAAQRALSMPEIVSEIVGYDAIDYKDPLYWTYFSSTGISPNLTRYARINSLWFWEVMRNLWWTASPYGKLNVLERLPRRRKQVYANFIVHIIFYNEPRGSCRDNKVLEGLYFPRLRLATMNLQPGQRFLSLPHIYAPELRELSINAATEYRNHNPGLVFSDMEMQKRLAKRLKKMMPFLERINLRVRSTDIRPEDLARFQANVTDVQFAITYVAPQA